LRRVLTRAAELKPRQCDCGRLPEMTAMTTDAEAQKSECRPFGPGRHFRRLQRGRLTTLPGRNW
jgi:hypothetical protein